MFRRILYWLTGKLPARLIAGDNGEPYLERYFLFRCLGVTAYLHRFVASDPDRGLHDHPWGWSASLMLAGGYREIRRAAVRHLKPGRINFIRGTDFHRIILPANRDAWTLFIHGKRTKGWGFVRDGKYHPFANDKDHNPARDWWHLMPNGRTMRAQQLGRDMDCVVSQIGTWADETFAPDGDYRGPSIVAHLAKEVRELAENPRDMEELADCVILLCHLAHQNGGNLQAAIARKFEINKRRKWGQPDVDGVVEHVRSDAL